MSTNGKAMEENEKQKYVQDPGNKNWNANINSRYKFLMICFEIET